MFPFFRTASRHRRREEIDLLVDIYGQNAFIIGYLKEFHMAISTEVQAVLDRAKQNTSLVQSVDLGMKGLSQQVADLQAKINALPVGNVLSDEDKAALSEAASDLDTAIVTLQKDIPANTTAGRSGDAGAQSGNSSGSQTGSGSSTGTGSDASQSSAASGNAGAGASQAGDASAQGSDGGAPKPLPGTGQS